VECGERVYVNDPRLIKKLATLIKELAVAREALERYESAIRWALGEGDDFPMREPGEGAYWWRNELRRRAALKLEEPTK
jgi:hypothetical protein